MQTATTQRAVKARSKAPKAPLYPELPTTDEKGFSLAVLLCQQAEVDAIQEFRWSATFRKKTKPLQYAIYGALSKAERTVKKYAEFCKNEGLLPFAHSHTTYFDQEVAA